ILANPAALGQRPQRRSRRPRPQVRITTTGDQLLGLSEKFNLPDPAPPQLDVVACNPLPANFAVRIDLPLHRLNIGDHREIEMLAPDKRGKLAQELPPYRRIASAGLCLDPGRPLPVLA